MAFEDLNVRVSASTADANAGLNRVEDNLEEVGDEAQSTSRSFGTLSASTGMLQGSFVGLSTVTMATLVPSLVTLSTVIAPLAVVFGGIAAAVASLGAVFGGLALVGVITHMDELKTAVAEARQEILEIVEPLGEVFGPLLVQAVEALPNLVQAIVNSLGPLDQFRNSLIEMGNMAMRIIPQVTAAMFDLAEEALPVLNQALSALETQGPGIFQTLRSVFNEVTPLVIDFGSAIADLLPEILEFGTTVANLVLPALTSLTDVLGNLISRVNQLQPGMRNLVVAGVTLAPILTTLGSVLASLGAPVIALIGALAGLGVAYNENIHGFRDAVNSVLPSLEELQTIAEDALTVVRTGVENLLEFVSPLADDIISLGGATTNAARDIASSFTPAIDSMTRAVERSQRPVEQLARTYRRVFRGIVQFLETFVVPTVRFVFSKVIAPVVNDAAAAVSQNLGPVISELSDTLNVLAERARVIGNVMIDVWQRIRPIVVPIVNALVDIFGTALSGAIDAVSESLQFFMNLIQGDFSGAIQNVENLLNNFVDTVTSIGSTIADSFANSIDALTPILSDWVQGGFNYLSGTGKDSAIGDIRQGAVTFGESVSTAVASAIDLAGIAVDAITEMGEAFADGVIDIASDIASFGEDVANTLIDAINDAIPNELSFSIDAVQVAGQTVVPAQTVSADIPDNPIPSAQTGAFVEESGLLNVHQGEQVVQSAQVSDRGKVEVQDSGPSEVRVTVEGDTGVIEDVSAQIIERRERRAKRQTGGSTQI